MDYSNLGIGGMFNPMQPQVDRLSYLQQMQQQNQFQQSNMQQPMMNQQMQMQSPMQQPQQPLQQPQQMQVQQSFNPQVIFVGSIEEVRVYPPDWSGNTSYFVDRTNGCMYTKQISLEDGLPKIKIYREVEEKQKEYLTKEEFESWKSTIEPLVGNQGGEKDE